MKALWERGVLVQIRSGMWSMEASLGANDIDKSESEIPDFVHLGYKRLFPKEVKNAFTRISTRARALSNRYGFDFFLTGAYFVPNSALETLLPLLEEAQTDFYKEVESFTDKYDNSMASFLNAYPDHRDRLAPFYPSVEEVRSRFYMNVWCYRVTSPGIPIGEFASLSDDVYVNWATDAVNILRKEAVEVANSIGKYIEDDNLNGRSLRKVTTLIERLASLDLVGDKELLDAARKVSSLQTLESTRVLRKAASKVPATMVRKLILD